jgi:hypothetical protein
MQRRSVVLLRDHDVHALEGNGPLQHWTDGPDAGLATSCSDEIRVWNEKRV